MKRHHLQSVIEYANKRTQMLCLRSMRVHTERKLASRSLKAKADFFLSLGMQSKAFYMLKVNRTVRQKAKFLV
jgi:hypothetical protein